MQTHRCRCNYNKNIILKFFNKFLIIIIKIRHISNLDFYLPFLPLFMAKTFTANIYVSKQFNSIPRNFHFPTNNYSFESLLQKYAYNLQWIHNTSQPLIQPWRSLKTFERQMQPLNFVSNETSHTRKSDSMKSTSPPKRSISINAM